MSAAPRLAARQEPRLNAVQVDDFLAVEFPPREPLLGDFIVSQSLNMVTASRGTGKTWVALSIALAAASGGRFLKWSAAAPVPVLYIDGEMPAVSIQKRLAELTRGLGVEFDPRNLRIVSPDLQDGPMPDLSTDYGQQQVAEIVRDAKLIICDNVSCLVRGPLNENDADSWSLAAEWGLRMRREHRSVLWIHHTGKNGAQRGTSKREDLLDVSVMLSRPPGYQANEGAAFVWEFSKFRNAEGNEADALCARLERDERGNLGWTYQRAEGVTDREILALHADGLSIRDIAEELGIPKSTVARKVKAVKAGVSK